MFAREEATVQSTTVGQLVARVTAAGDRLPGTDVRGQKEGDVLHGAGPRSRVMTQPLPHVVVASAGVGGRAATVLRRLCRGVAAVVGVP
jgi:hypothetical protein